MSSKGDQAHCERIAKELSLFGIDSTMRVVSAHKTPEMVLRIVDKYEAMSNPKVYVCCAGRSNALSGLIDGYVRSPVLSCPPYSDTFSGSDIYSSLRMASGIAPMFIMEPGNCALACAKMFALYDPKIADTVKKIQKANASMVYVQDCEVKSHGYVPRIQSNLGNVFDKTDIKLSPKNDHFQVEKYVGKVRDRYNDGKNVVLITTDRLTGFDRPLCKIPYKGMVLNMVSKFWFDETQHIIKNHILSVPHPNVTIGVAAKPFPIEFVVRGYMTGSSGTSMWTHYQKGVREYCGIKLPDGMVQNQKLWKNLITPTTKSDEHDELISPEQIVSKGYMTQEEWDFCSAKALELFEFAQQKALERGLILVDTKMEMGRGQDGEIILIDELFTPDSSRYWLAAGYEQAVAAGKPPANIDKEFVRLWFKDHCDPYKDEVLPEAPVEIVTELGRRYIMLYELITGKDFEFPDASVDVNQAVQRALDKLAA